MTSYAGLFNNLLRLTWKTTFKLCITVREINRRPVAPLTKGNAVEGELMLSNYLFFRLHIRIVPQVALAHGGENNGCALVCSLQNCIFNSAVTEHWIVLSVRDFVTIRKTLFTISYEKFSGINRTKLKIDAVKVSHFIRECVARWPLLSPRSLTVTSTWRPRLTAHCPIGERH